MGLEYLYLSASNTLIHADDILRVLESYLQVVSLHLVLLHVAYPWDKNPPPYPKLHPILETWKGAYLHGQRLRELVLDDVTISDDGLLRLLGIQKPMEHVPKPADESRDLADESRDLVDESRDLDDEHRKPPIKDEEHILESPALVYLKVGNSGPTHASAARILEECLDLEVLDVQETHMATLELFYSGDWPSAPSIKFLAIDIQHKDMTERECLSHPLARANSIPVFDLAQQEQIYRRLREMTSQRHLELKGYPIDFVTVRDMSFAVQLVFAHVSLSDGLLWITHFREWRDRLRRWEDTNDD